LAASCCAGAGSGIGNSSCCSKPNRFATFASYSHLSEEDSAISRTRPRCIRSARAPISFRNWKSLDALSERALSQPQNGCRWRIERPNREKFIHGRGSSRESTLFRNGPFSIMGLVPFGRKSGKGASTLALGSRFKLGALPFGPPRGQSRSISRRGVPGALARALLHLRHFPTAFRLFGCRLGISGLTDPG
jgi:hypothetical protein